MTGFSRAGTASPGGWRVLGRAAMPMLAVVIVNAAAQAGLVALAPPLPLAVGALLLAAVSGAVLLAAAFLLWWLAARAVASGGVSALALLARSCVAGVVVGAAGVLAPYVVPVVLVVAAAVVAGGGFRGAGAAAARHPWRTAGLALVTVLVVLLGWVAALLLGLFVTGAPASAVLWLVAGIAAAVLVAHWTALAHRHRGRNTVSRRLETPRPR